MRPLTSKKIYEDILKSGFKSTKRNAIKVENIKHVL